MALATQALAQLPGVPRVQTGMRATYYGSSASIPGSRTQAVLKPNCDPRVEECWVHDSTGQTIGTVDIPGPAGQGYTNVDILYKDQSVCVVRVTSYGFESLTGRLTTASAEGGVSTDGTCSDYWTDPAKLAQLEPQLTETFRVLKGPYTLGDLTVDTVTIASSGAGGRFSNSFDSVTGLLFVGSGSAQGDAVPTIDPDNVITPAAGSTMLVYTQFLNARLLPGLGAIETLPTHVLAANRLVYACSVVTAMHGAGQVESPCQVVVRIGEKNEIWAHVYTSTQSPGPFGGSSGLLETPDVITASGHGGVFASPTLLARLQAGATLDVDPVTGVLTTVASADSRLVAIVEETNSERKTFVYDLSSGWLVRYVVEVFTPMGSMTTRTDLTRVE